MSLMSDDTIRCILEYTCSMQARRNVHPLEAVTAHGLDGIVDQFGEKIMTANGIIRSEETILLDAITCPGCYTIWASKMVKTIDEETKLDDLCFRDPVGYHFAIPDVPLHVPCFRWGVRKQMSYSIRLSHAMSVSVAFDVVVVPTSWWVDDCEGEFGVIQIISANEPIPDELELSSYGYSEVIGYELVGWASENPDDE